MNNIILLDMDGVICNFVQGLIDSHGWDIKHNEFCSWNFHHTLGVSDEEMWEPTNEPHWWECLKPYPWADELITQLSIDHEVIFCTSPSLSNLCPSEKVSWLRAYGFMGYDKNSYQIGPKKDLNAKSGAILIDDSDSNVRKYQTAGGRAILFPQPWNKNWEYIDMRMEYTLGRFNSLSHE